MLPGHISLPGFYPESRKVEERLGLSLIDIFIQGRKRIDTHWRSTQEGSSSRGVKGALTGK
uniref:Deoxyribonuclease IV n=1 Tax=Echinococcus granulosus TaxID=6210 RepID=A0A068WA95_ECHGR|nr:hypothetical protein EgrG_000767300 [Echinococcus granulosus]